jgi:SH3 domain protein
MFNVRALMFLGLILLFMVCLPSVIDAATTVYVSDTTLEANLRSGTSQENRIIGMLKPGTQLTIVQEEDGWAKVSLEDGRTGWILRRYLSERQPWRVTAMNLTAENEQLQTQLRQLESQHRQLVQKHAELKKQMDGEQQKLQAVSKEYKDLRNSSSNYLNLKMAYENLQSETRENRAKLEEVEKAHKKLRLSTNIRWFLSGAGVLLLGWVLGSSMVRMRRRRSSDYYKL